ALIADVALKSNGFYTGLWASSGDAGLGTEYDFYAGYGFSAGPVSLDFNYTTYMYPSVPSGDNLGFDDVSDVAVTVGLKPSDDVSLTLMHRVGVGDILADDDYTYTTFTAAFGKFSALVGTHSDDSGAYDGLTHLDLSYAYTSNLTFTLGKVVDQGEAEWNDELKFIVKLSLPLGE
ncbi:MAG TPA: TorF family putative porin, partial [Cellvibrio sp.]